LNGAIKKMENCVEISVRARGEKCGEKGAEEEGMRMEWKREG
jgi:hypothetical protein